MKIFEFFSQNIPLGKMVEAGAVTRAGGAEKSTGSAALPVTVHFHT
jgi:hypothetical protein